MKQIFYLRKKIQSLVYSGYNLVRSPLLAAEIPMPGITVLKSEPVKRKQKKSIISSLLSNSSTKNPVSFFIKNTCGGIHCITFDNNGYVYAGSLGDSSEEIGKMGLKKILKIDHNGSIIEEYQINCQFITAIAISPNGSLYAAVLENQKGKVFKVINKYETLEIASGFSEISSLKFDSCENLVICAEKIYKIDHCGEKSILIPDSGSIDFNSGKDTLFISSFDGSELYCYPLGIDEPCIARKLSGELKGNKCIAVSPGGKILILSYNEKDILTILENNRIICQIPIEINLPMIYLPHRYILSNMAVGKKGFDENAVYITTWTGDIIKVQTGIDLVN